MSGILLLPSMAQRDVQKGRDASRQIMEMVAEAKDRGLVVHEVRVSEHLASYMRSFFAVAFAEFDGVMPNHLSGVPFYIGGTSGRDLEIKTSRKT